MDNYVMCQVTNTCPLNHHTYLAVETCWQHIKALGQQEIEQRPNQGGRSGKLHDQHSRNSCSGDNGLRLLLAYQFLLTVCLTAQGKQWQQLSHLILAFCEGYLMHAQSHC